MLWNCTTKMPCFIFHQHNPNERWTKCLVWCMSVGWRKLIPAFDVYWTMHHCDNRRIKPTRCHLLFYCTSYRLNMFWALLCPSSGKSTTLLCFSLQPRHYSSLTAPNLQPTANHDRNDQCGNQHYSHELPMMGIAVRESCWAYKKYNKIISDI